VEDYLYFEKLRDETQRVIFTFLRADPGHQRPLWKQFSIPYVVN
jgi:hypothetical protein